MNMMNGRIYTYENPKGFGQRILGTILFVGIVAGCLYLFYQVYKFLFYLSPLFIIASLIIYPKIVGNHIKMISQSFKQNFIAGIIELVLQLIGLPIVSIGLVVKAWAYKKFGLLKENIKSSEPFDERYTQYVEIVDTESEAASETTPKNQLKKEEVISYDDLFE